MTDPLSKAAGHLLSCLPQDGKPVGNIVLRRNSELSEEKFENAREELIARGHAVPGKGKGGALRRVLGKGRAHYAEFPVESLAEPFSRAGKAELAERLKGADNESPRALEDQTWMLAYYLKPTLIATQRDPIFQLEKQQFRPDICAVFDGFLLIADSKDTLHATYVSDWLDKVEYHRGEIALVCRRFELDHVIYVCVVREVSAIDPKVQERARKLSVKLIDARRVAYFVSLYRDAGVGVRDLFLGDVAPRIIHLEETQVPALAVRVGGKREAFVFSMNAHLLLPRALVSHREVHDPESGVMGYQRMLSKGRLKAIAKHIEVHKSFPTPIVVVLSKNIRFDLGKSNEGTGRSRLGHLWLSGKPRTVQVVDGQHRLFGYSLLPWSEDHVLHVIGYRESDDLDPATMFVDINSKQKPVSSGLMWELFPDIYGPGHLGYFRALCGAYNQRDLSELEKLRAQRSSQGGFKRLFDDFVEVIEGQYRTGFGGPKPSRRVADAVEAVIAAVEDVNRMGISLGSTHSHVFKEFDASELTRIAKKELGIDSFEKLVKTLHQEIIEGTGDKGPDNRLARVLSVTELLNIEPLRSLHSLRIYYSHKPSQIEPAKRKAAVASLQELLGSPSPLDPASLSPEEYEKAACGLLEGICTGVLKPALLRITSPTSAI